MPDTGIFVRLMDLAKLFGTTSHQIGRALAKLGLRVVGDTPTSKALNEGYAQKHYCQPRNDKYLYLWNLNKTAAVLIKAGFKPVISPENSFLLGKLEGVDLDD